MRSLALFACFVAAMAVCTAAYSQSPYPISGELDLDVRTHTLSTGNSYTELYEGTLLADADLKHGWRAEAEGTRTYNRNMMQEALAEKDAGANRFQAGVVRMPFGLFDSRETYASGLINYPIVRDDYGLHAVDF